MNEDYLWDKSGADAELAALENRLQPLRHRPQTAALLAALNQSPRAQISPAAQQNFILKILTALFAQLRVNPAQLALATALLLLTFGTPLFFLLSARNSGGARLTASGNLPSRASEAEVLSARFDTNEDLSPDLKAMPETIRRNAKSMLRRTPKSVQAIRGMNLARHINVAPADAQTASTATPGNRPTEIADAEALQARDDLLVALRLAGDSLRTTQEIVREQRLLINLSGN